MYDFSSPYTTDDTGTLLYSPFYALRSSITAVVLEEGVTSIGEYAFFYCTMLKNVELPDTLQTIGSRAFFNCIVMQDIQLPSSLQSIGNAAFDYCKTLTEIRIPASVTSIGSYAFSDCTNMQTFYVDEGSESYSTLDGALYNKAQTKLLFYPISSPVTTLILPDTLTSLTLSSELNDAVNLRCVVVPESLSTLTDYAFYYCNALEQVIFCGNAPKNYNDDYTDMQFKHDVTVSCDFSASGWAALMETSTNTYITWQDINGYTDELTIRTEKTEAEVGESCRLTAVLNPLLATAFTWSSSDTDVALVSGNGTLIAIAPGTTEITCTSSDGAYTASLTFTVTGEAFTAPSDTVTELDAAAVWSSTYNRCIQIPCETLHGMYFLNGSKLSFYSLISETTNTVYTFNGCTDAYAQDNTLYVLYGSTCYVYDLLTQGLVSTVTMPSGYTGSAVGVDQSGRIYLAGYNTSNSIDNRIFLCSPDGTVLSQTYSPTKVYSFSGFDSTNGNFYMESYYDYYSWGYSHPGRGLSMGCVSGNTIYTMETRSGFLESGIISRSLGCLMYLCQDVYLDHQDSSALLGDRYLVGCSVLTSQVQVMDSHADSLDTLMYLTREPLEYDLDSTYTDTTSVGTRAVYNESHDSIIIYENGNTLTEYNPLTGEKMGSFTTAHYVFSLNKMGSTLLIVEKDEDGSYYLETVDWSDPESISITGESSEMLVGTTQQLTLDNGSSFTSLYYWSSSDDTIASVTQTGMVSAWKEGTAVITCTSSDGSLTAVFTVTVVPADTEKVKAVTRADGYVSNNISDNNYTVWDDVMNSYLMENEDGTLTRVEYISGEGVLTEILGTDGTLYSSLVLEAELPLFGGFYSGEAYNFLVFGQSNTEESDSTEVLRIVRYTKDWERVDSTSVYGANTYVPFDAGNLRMDEQNGKLYIHTCHTMYDSGDGLHHQANMTYVLNEESMEMEQSYYDVMNVMQTGYVSHSFTQLVQTDEDYMFRVDHGDGGPRGIALTRCNLDGSITDVRYLNLLSIEGGYGDNYTGVSVGGMELSSDYCIVAYNSVDMDEDTYSASGQRNIYLVLADKALSGTKTIQLTNYESGSGITPRTPQLVKINEDQFLLMWEEYHTQTQTVTTKLVTLNGDGTLTSEITETDLRLSDCQPTVTSDGIVRWYTTNGSKMSLYAVSPYDLSSAVTNELTFTFDEETGTLTISGKGEMEDYSDSDETPWAEYLDKIEHIVIAEGVTSVGDYAFTSCTNLKSVSLADSVTSIGEYAFCGCSGLTELTLPETVQRIDAYAIGYSAAAEDAQTENFTLYGYAESAAVSYASENNLRFRALDVLYGDVDLSGEVELVDVVLLNRYLTGYDEQSLNTRQLLAAECYEDGKLNGKDSVEILRYLVELTDSLPEEG
jgi:uncharacterized protein YjdB